MKIAGLLSRPSTHLRRVLIKERRELRGAFATRIEPREEVQAAFVSSLRLSSRTNRTEPCADPVTAFRGSARPSCAAASICALSAGSGRITHDARPSSALAVALPSLPIMMRESDTACGLVAGPSTPRGS